MEPELPAVSLGSGSAGSPTLSVAVHSALLLWKNTRNSMSPFLLTIYSSTPLLPPLAIFPDHPCPPPEFINSFLLWLFVYLIPTSTDDKLTVLLCNLLVYTAVSLTDLGAMSTETGLCSPLQLGPRHPSYRQWMVRKYLLNYKQKNFKAPC